MVKLGSLGVDETALLTTLENLLEVELLAHVSDIDDSVTLDLIDSVSECSKVSGSVAESTIRLLDHEWWCLLLAHEDALSTLILNDDSLLLEFLNHW